MKGFIELRALGGHKAFFPIERIAFGNSNIGTLVFFNSSTYGVEETAEEIAAKIEEATEQKTETCEWCEMASECEYEVTFFRDDDRRATRRSLMPKFCPNCGKRLKEERDGKR